MFCGWYGYSMVGQRLVMSLIDVGDRNYNVQVMKDRPYHPIIRLMLVFLDRHEQNSQNKGHALR